MAPLLRERSLMLTAYEGRFTPRCRRSLSRRAGVQRWRSGRHRQGISQNRSTGLTRPQRSSRELKNKELLRGLASRWTEFGRRHSHTGKRNVLVDYWLSARDRGCDSYCPSWARIAGNALRLGRASFSQSRQITSLQDVAL